MVGRAQVKPGGCRCYTGWMYSIVKRLRAGGVRRPNNEITDDPGYEGELRVGAAGTVVTAILIEQDDEHMRPIIPPLEHAQLTVMRVDMMLFHGIERDKGTGAGTEQEWSVQIIGFEAPGLRY